MEFVEYGNSDGNLVVYFHGAPGAMQECALFDSYAKARNLRVICFDKFSIDSSLTSASYYLHLARQVRSQAGAEPVDFIGFSIGAHCALEVSALLPGQVRHTHLISAAAPISSGDFIDEMAGGLVFRLAMENRALFSLIPLGQTIMAILAPQVLVRLLFASAAGADLALCKRADFKAYIAPVLKHCFKNHVKGYQRDIDLYVTWPGQLAGYAGSVHLWHGTQDNWSPFAMASYLSNAIEGATSVHAMEGLSHYSCLFQVAPEICAQLENS